MRFLAVPYPYLATLLFSATVFANPAPQNVPPPCGLKPSTVDNYPQSQLVVYNRGGIYDSKLVYMPIIFGIPERPIYTPLVIYKDAAPTDTNVLKATLKKKQLFNQFSSIPANVVAVPDRNGLFKVYFRSGGMLDGPVDTAGAFYVIQGQCGPGNFNIDELRSDLGNFCVITPSGATSATVHIKTDEYDELKDGSTNPCVEVVLTVGKAIPETE